MARRSLAAAGVLVLGTGGGVLLVLLALRLPEPLGPAALVALPIGLLLPALALRDERWAIALFALTLPAGLTTLAGGVQVVQVAAVGSTGLIILARLQRRHTPLVLPPALLVLLLLVGWSLMTMPVAVDAARAMRWNVALLTAVLLAAAVVTATRASIERLRDLALMLFAGSVATCVLALPESAQRRSFGAAVVDGRAQGVFNQPNELGLFAGTTVMLALALLVSVHTARHPRRERWAVGLGGTVALIALLLSLSRGAWVGTLLALIVAMSFMPAVRRLVLTVLAVVASVVIVMVGTGATPSQLLVVGARAGLLTDRGANPYDERPAIWSEGIRQVQDYPWTGVGAAGFTDASLRSTSDVVASVRPSHAHNVVLNFAAEGGLPAGIALVFATVLVAVSVLRGRSRQGWSPTNRAFIMALGCAPLVVLGQGMLDAPLRNPTTLLHTAAVLGLGVACGHVRPSPVPAVRRSDRSADVTHGVSPGRRGVDQTITTRTRDEENETCGE